MAKKAIEILRTDASTFTGATSWISELAWRDFYISKTHHFLSSKKIERSDSSEYFPWRDDTEQYEKWCAGQTGIPIIDAIMRQLCSEGWISNRARMVTASFLTKQLLIDWRWGSDWFMKKLIDGDPFANSGGWQWVAGVGVGSAPYFRIFNPVLQAKKYDPHGEYVRRWVPELASIQSQNIHEPWLLNEENRKNSDSENYPSPIVDLNAARDRALSVYKTTRGNNR
jgi:deoxyribodipyrimidine photo-lyase